MKPTSSTIQTAAAGAGGARPGAGRKPIGKTAKKLLTVRVSPDVGALVEQQPVGTRSQYVEAAIRQYSRTLK